MTIDGIPMEGLDDLPLAGRMVADELGEIMDEIPGDDADDRMRLAIGRLGYAVEEGANV